MDRRSLLAGVAGFAAAGVLPRSANAQQWAPSRAMRIVVPYTAGGASDITARLVAERLRPRLGQPGVVENKPGASGIIGTEAVAKAVPDGHTLALVASSHVVNVSSVRYRYVSGARRTQSLTGSPRRSHHALIPRNPGQAWSTA